MFFFIDIEGTKRNSYLHRTGVLQIIIIKFKFAGTVDKIIVASYVVKSKERTRWVSRVCGVYVTGRLISDLSSFKSAV